MKKVYPLMMRHMDLIWRRRFNGQFKADGHLIRSYSEIEDLIFDQTLDFCERYGYPGAAECAWQIRTYLDRNPDELERVKRLVAEDKFELEGGGETLIDSNLVCGESIYRNMYNGMSYYRDVFANHPITAQCCDIFGLSAQLPQIFRQFGLYNVNNFSRVFKKHKPFWKGLDGSVICLHSVEDTGEFQWVGHSVQPCDACGGEGCEICDYTGFDRSRQAKEVNYKEHEERLDDYFNRHANEDALFDIENGEESLYPDDFPTVYERKAKEHGFTPVYDNYDQYFKDLFPDDYEALKTGNIPEDKIDSRVEGNPVFCGCYTSRIKIKQYNRMLEDMLLTAETLSTIAFDKKDYPYKKLRDLWRKMELLQFHDCITGSHSDSAYDELTTLARELTNDSMRLIKRALHVLNEGEDGFTLFNVTDTDAVSYPLHAIVPVFDGTEYVDVFDDDGNKLPVANVKRVPTAVNATLDITFIGNIPAYSAKHFTFKPAAKKEATVLNDNHIENEFYRIGREGIFDKKLGRMITKPGLIRLTDEIGDPWAKFDPETAFISLTGSTTTSLSSENMSEMVFEGTYSNEKLGAKELKYKVTAKLYNGVAGVYYNTEIDWNGENCHIYAEFPLVFDTEETALYEIPFGTLERGRIDFQNDAMSIADSYPAVGFAACRDKKNGYTVALLNKGIPGYMVSNDCISLSLLRSPTQDKHGGLWFAGAREIGHYEYEYMLTSFAGVANDTGDLVRLARLYNHKMPCGKGVAKVTKLISDVKEKGTVITSVRRTNEGAIQMRAYEPYGKKAVLETEAAFAETSPLAENAEGRTKRNFRFRPYEIKTLTERG